MKILPNNKLITRKEYKHLPNLRQNLTLYAARAAPPLAVNKIHNHKNIYYILVDFILILILSRNI